MLRLLIVDDSLTDADNVINTLRNAGHAVRASREDAPLVLEQLLSDQVWDLLICRAGLPSLSAADVVELLQRMGNDLPCIILINDHTSEADYYTLPVEDIVRIDDPLRLQFAVTRELKNLTMRRLGRRHERALRESEKRSAALLESSRDAVAYMHEGMHVYVNQAYLKLFGYGDADDVDGLPMLDLLAADDHGRFKSVFRDFSEDTESVPVSMEAHCLRADGLAFQAQIEFSHARVEDEDCTQVVIRDGAKLSTADDAQIKQLHEYDLLTGLFNRLHFLDELEKCIYHVAEGHGQAELLYLELDDFQLMKKQVGLSTCDVIIKSVAELLRKNQLDGEKIGRYGDQVFTVIIPTNHDSSVDERAQSFLETVAGYVSHVNGKTIELSCSIGIARINESHATPEAVLEQADKACMQAQRAGGNQFARYQAMAIIETDSAETWQKRLEKALQQDGFTLHYQPIISLHGESQQLYEVLLRLQVNDQLIKAEQFIDYAASAMLMVDIDKWVIRMAVDILREHRQQQPRTRFFIKLSEQSINTPNFVDWLHATLSAHQLNGQALIFEISESIAANNLEKAQLVISRLKQLGCEFGLEHFGSGIDFSNSLNALDVDYLKINGAFVENMAYDSENQAAVKAIIGMTKQAGKRSIAEFVSDANSMALLWRLGVDYAQGYYIHKPSEKLDYNFEDADF